MSEISGNPEYDAARAKWGGTWRMPAHDETLELLEELHLGMGRRARRSGIQSYRA